MYLIRPWLYVGRYRDTLDAAHLRLHDVGAMLQLAEAVEHPGVLSLYLPVEDGEALRPEFLRRGVDFVLEHRRSGQVVLIACGAGRSRSVAYAVASLKEDHVATNWGDRELARSWKRVASRIRQAAHAAGQERL